jgi:hypothetical protein
MSNAHTTAATSKLEARRDAAEIVARYNGEDLIFEGGARCAFGPDTTRYQSTVAVSAFVSASGEVHSISFHKTVAAAQKRRPTQWHAAGTYVIWAPVTEVAEESVTSGDAPEPGTAAAAKVEMDRRVHNRAAKKSGEARIEAASDWAFQATSQELKALVA